MESAFKIEVERCEVVHLPQHAGEAGKLVVAEEGSLPFIPRRVFFITDLHPHKARGNHTHQGSRQVIFCIRGSFDLKLDDGRRTQTITLSDPTVGIYLGPLLWHEMSHFSQDCVILIFADAPYDESKVLRSYDEFVALIQS